MSRIGRVLKGYLFWTHDRGSFHYDVMVTLILLFVFLGPRFIDFKDQPAGHPPHPTSIEITSDGDHGLICLVDASAVDAQSEGMVRTNLLRLIRPIAGEVTIDKIEQVRDQAGRIVAYRALIHK
ncbi:MAG TPA: hypothetical protein VNV88_12145 [Candidatus Solibacter sp.]|jgi:hypothetical protein|nr:hypothetical protein [Candidatus Solibacter sp.]